MRFVYQIYTTHRDKIIDYLELGKYDLLNDEQASAKFDEWFHEALTGRITFNENEYELVEVSINPKRPIVIKDREFKVVNLVLTPKDNPNYFQYIMVDMQDPEEE